MKSHIEILAEAVDRFLTPHRNDCGKYGYKGQFSEENTDAENESYCTCGRNKIKALEDMKIALRNYQSGAKS